MFDSDLARRVTPDCPPVVTRLAVLDGEEGPAPPKILCPGCLVPKKTRQEGGGHGRRGRIATLAAISQPA